MIPICTITFDWFIRYLLPKLSLPILNSKKTPLQKRDEVREDSNRLGIFIKLSAALLIPDIIVVSADKRLSLAKLAQNVKEMFGTSSRILKTPLQSYL